MLVFCCLLIVSVLLNAHCYCEATCKLMVCLKLKSVQGTVASLSSSVSRSVWDFLLLLIQLLLWSFALFSALLVCCNVEHTPTITHSHTCHITTRNKHDLKKIRVKGLLFISQGPLTYCFDILVGFVLLFFFPTRCRFQNMPNQDSLENSCH